MFVAIRLKLLVYLSFIVPVVPELVYNPDATTSLASSSMKSAPSTERNLKHFKFRSVLGADFILLDAKEVVASGLYTSSGTTGTIKERYTNNFNLIATNILAFKKQFGKSHSLDMTLGQEAQVLNNKYT